MRLIAPNNVSVRTLQTQMGYVLGLGEQGRRRTRLHGGPVF